MSVAGPILVGIAYVLLMSLLADQPRQRLNAVLVAGAGAVYWSGGGLGAWEFVFGAVMTYVAYRGLESWHWLGVGWLLHTGWDVLHHRAGNPIIPMLHDSSLGCAICDPVIAVWCFAGGPSVLSGPRSSWRGRLSG
ncbi:DUF6010 family protein [Actinoplanes oblitus]|uniref:DUF6010 family protein n=1 Tax=Actinoplanes oblitus TaxID=3040509 RepID=A0ABY8WR92_9ACTN|nr:DUF6010 family protein [Actinoplanes oblitus]WIM99312.1 DUF6010 family protein [Actinoplanes oblitus]